MKHGAKHIAVPSFVNTRREVALISGALFQAPYGFIPLKPNDLEILDRNGKFITTVGGKAFFHSLASKTIKLLTADENGTVIEYYELKRLNDAE